MKGVLRSNVSEGRVGVGSGRAGDIVGSVLKVGLFVEESALVLTGMHLSKHLSISLQFLCNLNFETNLMPYHQLRYPHSLLNSVIDCCFLCCDYLYDSFKACLMMVII